MRGQLRLFALGAGLGLLVTFGACFQLIESSKKFACEQDADCWDGLKCVRNVCGATAKPEPAPRPEPPRSEPSGDASTPEPAKETAAEQAPDIECQVPGGSIKLCQEDVDCDSGKCGAFDIPGCTEQSKACTCTKNDECKTGQQCCTQGNQGVCIPSITQCPTAP